MELGEFLALIVVGALSGATAASVMRLGKSRGLGSWLQNTFVGILGALVGGLIFRALDLDLPDFLSEPITLADLLVAFVGAVVVIIVAGFVRKR
jgi:uncharacterized membrane protein YeaQ/YmgE (transglycosylase-associated protein family)